MTPDLSAELNAIPPDDNLVEALDALMEEWRSRDVGPDGVEAVLAYIARHPHRDVGSPGPLVHFAEEHHRRGYEAALLRSFADRPTPLTAWMLNRLRNGTTDPTERATYRAALETGLANPATDADTRTEIRSFLSDAP